MCVAFLEIFEMFFVNSKNSFWMLQTKKKKKKSNPKNSNSNYQHISGCPCNHHSD